MGSFKLFPWINSLYKLYCRVYGSYQRDRNYRRFMVLINHSVFSYYSFGYFKNLRWDFVF